MIEDRLPGLERLFNELVKFPRVLLVDDDESDLILAGRIFNLAGFITSGAKSAEEAKSVVRRGGYDLIVADLKMGGAGGASFIRFCWNEIGGAKLAVLTGYPNSDELLGLIRERPLTILAKPVNLDMVIGLMKTLNINSPIFYGWRYDDTTAIQSKPVGH